MRVQCVTRQKLSASILRRLGSVSSEAERDTGRIKPEVGPCCNPLYLNMAHCMVVSKCLHIFIFC